MDLSDYRKRIDSIDAQLLALFEQRMDVATEIAAYKKERDLPVLDAAREQAKLDAISARVRPEYAEYARRLYETLFAVSRDRQNRLNDPQT